MKLLSRRLQWQNGVSVSGLVDALLFQLALVLYFGCLEAGNLAFLARRLRTIGVTHKVTTDTNFPLDSDDLRKYFQRPLQVPTFAELKPVIWTAKKRAAVAAADREQRAIAQTKIKDIYSLRFRIDKAINEILSLPASQRAVVEPEAFRPEPTPTKLDHTELALRHLELVENMSSLMTQAFEMRLGKSPKQPQQGATAEPGEASTEAEEEKPAPTADVQSKADPAIHISRAARPQVQGAIRRNPDSRATAASSTCLRAAPRPVVCSPEQRAGAPFGRDAGAPRRAGH